MTRLILIRHGQTNWNVERRKQGRNDQPLNEEGARQASLAARHVKENYDVTKVWASPLQRCYKTALEFGMPVHTSDHLLEIDYGDWEGMLAEDIEKTSPEVAQKGADYVDPPGGEQRSNLPVRGNLWLEEANLRADTGDVVLVGHGGSMKGLLAAVLDLPDSSMFNFVIDNCSVSVIGIHPTGQEPNTLALLNQTNHLKA